MTIRRLDTLTVLLLVVYTLTGCAGRGSVGTSLGETVPKKVLWAWERPEDLRFTDPNEYAVAFLAQTLYLEKERVTPRPRRQPLEVSPGSYLTAVTRIETKKGTFERPDFSSAMREETVAIIKQTLELPDVRAVQIDFDATVSERSFYRAMMSDLRRELPPDVPLTMTALASWCVGDSWLTGMPVSEAVPMVFQMGADKEKIANYLRNGNDWSEPLCLGSYGISLEEGRYEGMRDGRRVYLFNNTAWKSADLMRP